MCLSASVLCLTHVVVLQAKLGIAMILHKYTLSLKPGAVVHYRVTISEHAGRPAYERAKAHSALMH